MMNKTLATTLAVISASSLFLATGAQAQECPNVSTFKLTAKENHLDLNDNMPICVLVGESGEIDFTFSIKIANPIQVGPGDVTVEKKSKESPLTFEGSNTDDVNELRVKVTGNPGDQEEFRYFIKVANIGELDPTVRVIDNNSFLRAQTQVLEDHLEANGIAPKDVQTLVDMTEKY